MRFGVRSRARVVQPSPAPLAGALVVAIVTFAALSCSPPASSNRATRGDDALAAVPEPDGVYCDGTRRPAATISGAQPGETIEFTSPMPISPPDLTADGDGVAQMTWRCDETESRLTWELTATGVDSGRTARFTITGSERDPLLDTILIHEATTEVIVCDNTSRTVATLSNAEPNEVITFTSPDSSSITPTVAGPGGDVEVRWTCSAEDDGARWLITARGDSSKRTAEFTITGQAPGPAEPGGIVVELVENPFVCDRGRRVVAELTNLTPNVALEFVVSPADEPLRPGRATAAGTSRVFWQCDRRDDGTTWELTVTEDAPTRRTVTFTFGATTLESPVAVDLLEDPFVCNSATREVAVLRNFVSRETIDFESPQSDAIRSGTADETGGLPVRWSCDASQAGTVWEVTATGATSGASITFTISGAAP